MTPFQKIFWRRILPYNWPLEAIGFYGSLNHTMPFQASMSLPSIPSAHNALLQLFSQLLPTSVPDRAIVPVLHTLKSCYMAPLPCSGLLEVRGRVF